MSSPGSGGPPEELAIWQGRRGLLNTVLCCLAGLICAVALLLFLERSVVAPACSAYAKAHAMQYTDFDMVGVRTTSNVVCVMTRADGKKQTQHLNELVPYFTDLFVGILMSLEFTVPSFIVLIAVLRGLWYMRGLRRGANGPG